MSAFRGARLLVSFGHHGLKCNRLHQRRIVSLGLTSLCQVTMKKRALLDTNVLPVNKSDLSGVGILSPTLTTLFSTEALALAGDEPWNVSAEDMQPGRVNKWLAPVDQSTGRHRKTTTRNNTGHHGNYTAFIAGRNFSYNEEYLKELFIQFGEVHEVRIPKKKLYGDTTARPGQFGYGFVEFAHNESLQKALAAKTMATFDGNILEIKDVLQPTRNKNYYTAFIGGFINFRYNEEYLKELFLQFGEVHQVKIPHKQLYGDTTARPGEFRYGFVKFTHKESLQKALATKTMAISNGNILEIKDVLQPMRSKNTFLMDRLPDDVNVQQVYDYCQTFGKVQFINLMLNRRSLEDPSVKRNKAVVLFNDNKDIILDKEHIIGTSTIIVEKVNNPRRQKVFRCCSILLEGVAQHITEEQVSTHFSSVGREVHSILFLKDKGSDEHNGCCVVRFEHQSEARHASEEFLQEIDGVRVRVRSLAIMIE